MCLLQNGSGHFSFSGGSGGRSRNGSGASSRGRRKGHPSAVRRTEGADPDDPAGNPAGLRTTQRSKEGGDQATGTQV